MRVESAVGPSKREAAGRAALVGAAGAALVGALGLVGLATPAIRLARINPTYRPIAPSAAAALIILGLLLGRLAYGPMRRRARIAVAAVAALVALYGLLDLVGFLVSADLNREDLLTTYLARAWSRRLMPMSPVAAVLMFVTSGAIVAQLLAPAAARARQGRWLAGTAGALGAVAVGLSLTFVLSYLYGVPLLYGSVALPIAATSAFGFLLLGLGVVAAAGPTQWPLRPFTGASVRARLLRVFLPLTILIVLVSSLSLERAPVLAHLNRALEGAFLAVIFAAVVSWVVARVAAVLGAAIEQAQTAQREAERARAEIAERMNSEINHRMKNNLALLSSVLQMQLSTLPSPSQAADAVQDAIARITSLSVVHEELYRGHPGQVDLGDVLRRVGEIGARTLASREIALSAACESCYVSSKLGSTLAILANELVTNAIKYGAAAEDGRLHLSIALACIDGALRLRIWNSGNPVPAGFDPSQQSGMGLALVHGVVAGELRGSFTLRPDHGGTLAELTFAGGPQPWSPAAPEADAVASGDTR